MEKTNCKTLVVLGGLGTLVHAEHTAQLACHLCEEEDAELILAYPIIVPQAMPLDASLPTQERAADQALERGKAAAARFGCRVTTRVVRHRRPADAILELAARERVSRIVLGMRIDPHVLRAYDQVESAETEIVHRAECEVIIDREPIVEHV